MKKNILIIAFLILWASAAAAQQKAPPGSPESQPGVLETAIRVGYRWVWLDGNTRAGEYEYLHSSLAGSVNLEWDPLPHRFVLESFHLNEKDFYSTMDYSYRDVVVVNLLARGLYHNLQHYSFGPDDLSTPSPSFTDRDPGAKYWKEFDAASAFVRFKTPDFPLHIYAEAREVEDRGLVQQRFLLTTTGFDKVSESRAIHWSVTEAKVGANSHLGPVEIDYSHTEKKFEATRDKVLYDVNPAGDTYPHNLIPDLKSSSDTVKIHTSHTGRMVAAATVSEGEKKNEDSGARAGYRNAAGDLTVMPLTNLVFYIKYRHYDLDLDNPGTVKNEFTDTYVTVRDSISSQRNVITGTVWYKPADRLTLKGEYALDEVRRDVGSDGNSWDVSEHTTKKTAKLGATYRVMNRLTARADYSHKETENPAYNMDPSVSDAATASATWTPIPKIQALVSYGGVREKRDELDAPLAGGSRENARDQVLGSVTVLMGQRSSLTASYAFFRNKVEDTLTYLIQSGSLLVTEPGVPYTDVSHTVALALTHAYDERITLTAEASRSYSRGHFKNSGEVDNTSGIAEFSDLKVIESLYSAGIEVQHSKSAATELRYQYRQYDDRIDNTQDGIAKILLAAVSLKW